MTTLTPIPDPSRSATFSEPVKLPVTSILAFILLGVMIASLGFGGILYYFAHSGRLIMQRGDVSKEVIHTHFVALDPLLVNLADVGGSSYLRLGVTLQVAGIVEKKDSKTKDDSSGVRAVAAIRDTTLSVLGRQKANELLAPDGKEHLKVELKRAFVEHNGDLKVTALFFTDFLVQQ